jgi:hypothetical protein
MPGMGAEVLAEGEGRIAADIVFVHGLRGDRQKTWTKKANAKDGIPEDVFWPRDLLAKEQWMKNSRIITVRT